MQAFAMAPVTALSAVIMFYLLRLFFSTDLIGLGLSLLYAFGTPVFFRTGYLNHNLMLRPLCIYGVPCTLGSLCRVPAGQCDCAIFLEEWLGEQHCCLTIAGLFFSSGF